jgi:hypothetical protein
MRKLFKLFMASLMVGFCHGATASEEPIEPLNQVLATGNCTLVPNFVQSSGLD